MPVALILDFGANTAAYQSALNALPAFGVVIRRVSPAFNQIAVTAPDNVVALLRPGSTTIPGIFNSINDISIRPALAPIFVGEVGGLTAQLRAMAAPGIDWPEMSVTVPESAGYMGLPVGLTGDGVRVAVIDTGVDATHPALEGQVEKSITVVNASPGDGFGHGTWVAACIAGKEGLDPQGHRFQGIAPGAKIVSIKVLDDEGNGLMSDVVAGLEAALNEKVDLINMSLGSGADIGIDPVASAVETVASRGILSVVAAGNSGPYPSTIGTPGSAPHALTVAAGSIPIGGYIDGGLTAAFSSRGPTLRTFYKPDVEAPGGHGGYDALQRRTTPELIYGPSAGYLDTLIDGVADGWAPLAGTSMATPHVAGLLAALAQKYRFNRADLDAAFAGTARRTSSYKDFEHGWGFVDGVGLTQYLERNRMYR